MAYDKMSWWNPLGGHIDSNKTWREALKREAREEAGVTIINVLIIGYILVEHIYGETDVRNIQLHCCQLSKMNKKLSSVIQTNNEQTVFTWHPKVIIEGLKPKNIYGFCITNDNKVVLVRDKDETRFTLPVGGIQEGESPIEALMREFKEEAQFIPLNIKLLGTLEVKVTNKMGKIIEHHQQVRFVCYIDNPGDFIPEKDGWETVERIFVNIEELENYLEWLAFPSGRAQLVDLQRTFDKKSILDPIIQTLC